MILSSRRKRTGSLQVKLILPLLTVCVAALVSHVILTLASMPQAVTIMLAAVLIGAAVGYWLQVRLILRPLRALRLPSSDGGESAAIMNDEIDTLVSHLNETLKSLALSDAHFRAIINTAADGFITFDETGHILWLNRAAEKMFGCEAQQAIGKPMRTFIPISEESGLLLRSISTGEVKLFTPKRIVEGNRIDLTKFPIELSVGKAQVGDKPTWIAVVHDLTNQKKAEEALRLHALTFANISDGVLLTDLDGRIIDVNPAAESMFGYNRAEILGKTATALHPEQGTGPLNSQVLALMGKQGRWFGELTFLRHEGLSGLSETVIVSLRDERERRVGTMRVYRDITDRKRAEIALRESNRLVRAIIDAFPGLINARDRKSKYLLMNQFQAELYGTTVDKAVGKAPSELINPWYGAQAVQNDQKVITTGKPLLAYEESIPDAKNRTHTWLTTTVPLFGEAPGGSPLPVRGVVNVSVEISDRKRAEEELRESQANLMALIENTQDAIWLLDPEGRLVTFNSAFRQMAQDYWGQVPRAGTQPVLWLSQADQANWLAHRQRALAGQRLTVEYRWLRKGAPHFWEVSFNPVRIGAQVVGASVYARNITERKRADEARFVRKIAEASPHVMFVFDLREQRIIYMNRQITGALGYTPEEIEQLRSGLYPRLLHTDDLRRLPEVMAQAEKMADGQVIEAEFRIKSSDRTWRWFSGRLTVFSRMPNGQVHEIIASAQDITERKMSEQQIRDALREKEALLKEVHHRVKNNLQIITSLLNLQESTISDRLPGGTAEPTGHAADTSASSNPTESAEGVRHEQIPAARAIAEMFAEMKNRVRSMALLHETLYRSEDLAKIDLPVYIESLCGQLARSYGVDRKWVALDIDVAPVTLDLDRALPCGLVINELVSNAFKYAFPEVATRAARIRDQRLGLFNDGPTGKGEVAPTIDPGATAELDGVIPPHHVSVAFHQKPDRTYVLSVRDDGVGLPADWDARKTTSLGLRLVSDLTRQIRGTLNVERNGGARFTIAFPPPDTGNS